MNRPALLLAASLALAANHSALAGARSPAGRARPLARGVAGKPQAPVAIEAQVAAATATITLRFEQAGTDVEVAASGTEGLAVRGGPVLATSRAVAAGEVLSFNVPFTPGPGRSLLSVRVRGRFGQGERAAVRAFPVGKPSAAQQQKEAREKPTRVGGEPVRLLPAQETRK